MTRKQLYLLIVPTPSQLLLYPVLSAVLFGLIFSQNLMHKFTAKELDLSILNGFNYQAEISRYLDNNFTHTLVIVLFWGLIGLIAYTLVWLVTNALINARNDIVVETEYANKGATTRRVQTNIERFALASLLLAVIGLTALVLVPFWLGAFTTFIISPVSLLGITWAIVAILGFAANAYAIVTLGQVVFKLS
jgi:hypothetical protein